MKIAEFCCLRRDAGLGFFNRRYPILWLNPLEMFHSRLGYASLEIARDENVEFRYCDLRPARLNQPFHIFTPILKRSDALLLSFEFSSAREQVRCLSVEFRLERVQAPESP